MDIVEPPRRDEAIRPDAASRLRARVSASALGGAKLLDLERKPVVLGTAWRDRTAVLVFVRHFG